MNFPYMQQGDRLPVVSVLQKLLNREGARLLVDGHFGANTHQAVLDYQLRNGLLSNGRVERQTWSRLVAGYQLPIIDCIDVWDENLYQMEASDIRQAGGNPIIIGGMSNGLEAAVASIVRESQGRRTFLLRFHGHGSSGVASISDGHGEVGDGHGSYMGISARAAMRRALLPLRNIFGPYGSVQFMHCSTGAGEDGRRFLETVADTLGVPATAAQVAQEGGGLDTFKFEGPTYTALPYGQTLRSWSRSLPRLQAGVRR